MYQLAGEFECKIDIKGRLKLPAGLLSQFNEQAPMKFILNRGFEKHLILYPENVWAEKTKEIDRLNIYQEKNRKVIRYWYRGATKVVTDKASRILIPKSLISYGQFEKDLMLFAYQSHVEIWAKKLYELMIEDEPEQFSDIADTAFGSQDSDS